MKQSKTNTFIRLCALVATVVLVGADLVGLAQNTNSSTTNDTSAQNTNTTTRTGGRRRGRRRTARTGDMNMNANTGEPGDNANVSTGEPSMQNTNDNANSGEMTMPTTGTGGRRRRGRRRGAPPAPPADTGMPAETSGAMATGAQGATSSLGRLGETASLDGTYTGTVNYPDGGMSGDATLTITGNTFTLESGGNTQTGTLTSQQWPGQIAVTMRFGTETPAKIISLRAKKTGNGLMLMSTSGESHQFSFHSGGGGHGAMMGGGRRRRRGGRRRAATPPPPAAEPTTPPPSL